MTDIEIAWAAGLMEGEGCFYTFMGNGGRSGPYIGINVTSTDRDVLEKLKGICGGNILSKKTASNYKPAWQWQLYSKKAVPILSAIRPYLGERRGKKVDDLLRIGRQTLV